MKVAAGFVIYKRVSENILYLLLQTSYGEHHWTPPKGTPFFLQIAYLINFIKDMWILVKLRW